MVPFESISEALLGVYVQLSILPITIEETTSASMTIIWNFIAANDSKANRIKVVRTLQRYRIDVSDK